MTQAQFAFDGSTDEERPDIYVAEVFENSYGDLRVKLDGDTYEAKDIIKFDWETTHHDFDGSDNTWVVDASAMDELGERLEEGGFSFDDGLDSGRYDDPLEELFEYAEEGDDIIVKYEQKNGNGTSEKSGRVVGTKRMKRDAPRIAFRRHGDNHYMYLEPDEYGNSSLFTGGSHSPYVGAPTEVIIETEEDRPKSNETDESEGSDNAFGIDPDAEQEVEL
jgi:hypothetical protein